MVKYKSAKSMLMNTYIDLYPQHKLVTNAHRLLSIGKWQQEIFNSQIRCSRSYRSYLPYMVRREKHAREKQSAVVWLSIQAPFG